MTTSHFKCKGINRKPQNVPSRECKDPLGEKCTRHNQDAAPERRASGMVPSTELQGQRARVKAGESPRDLHSSSPSATREHATTVLPKSRFKPRGGRTSGGRNHDGDLLVVWLITQLKVFLCVEAAWGERDDKRGWSWKRARGAAVSSPLTSTFAFIV